MFTPGGGLRERAVTPAGQPCLQDLVTALCAQGCRPRGLGEGVRAHPLPPWYCTRPVVSLYLAHIFGNGLSNKLSPKFLI